MARHIFQSTLNDQHGIVVVAGKVTVKLSGTSTLATVYESKTGAAITGSVITTGTDGSYLFWVDTADYSTTQAFRLVLETGRGSGTNTLDDIEIFYGGDTPADNVFRIQDNLDRTKQIAFQASGISTGTTRTVTMPNKDITLIDSSDAIVEGTAVLSTGEAGGTKFLREDGDNSCSWQTVVSEGTELKSTGEAGGSKFLREDGDNSCSWQTITGGGPSLGTDSVIRTNAKTISENITFAGDENGSTVGPVSVANTYTVVVSNGSTWTII